MATVEVVRHEEISIWSRSSRGWVSKRRSVGDDDTASADDPEAAPFVRPGPGAYLDHPWDEDVAKVDGKVFVFLGLEDRPDPGMTVKLRESHEQALAVPGVAPSGYGLGRSGWVDVSLGASKLPPPVLRDWVEESYRLVARKGRIAELGAGARRR